MLNGTKYQDEDVHTLKGMVCRNLEQTHEFWCFSDRPIRGINCIITDENWPGWWAKLLLFRYAPQEDQHLYLDLDTVVTGNLDRLLSNRLSMPANWAQSGHGGCQSSVMSWAGDYSFIPDEFDPSKLEAPERSNCGAYEGLWGDQEFITRLMGEPGGEIKPMNHVYSYKYHCRQSLPEDASVVCFHGEPKPGQVSDTWVRLSMQAA